MLEPADIAALQLELQASGTDFALVTVVRAFAPTSAIAGAQAIVERSGALHGWIGGGCTRGVVIGAAQEAMRRGLPTLVRISNEAMPEESGIEHHAMRCASNGTVELFVHPVLFSPGLCVVGGSPAAAEARHFAERLGIPLGEDAARAPIVLIATQGEGDEAALAQALEGQASHVLMIASARKAEHLREAMRARGIVEDRLAALQAPAGVPIGAATPAEIALAALAEVVRLRRSGAPLAASEIGAASEAAQARAPAAPFATAVSRTRPGAHASAAPSGPSAAVAPSASLPSAASLGTSSAALPSAVPSASAAPSASQGLPAASASPPPGSAAVPPPGYVNPVCGAPITAAMVIHTREYEGLTQYFCCDGCRDEFERDPARYTALARARLEVTA